MTNISPTVLKSIGVGILLIPILFLAMFAIGEITSGGIGHVIQLLPIIALLVVAWRYPLIGGTILIISSIVLGALYATSVGFIWSVIAVVESFLFIPLLVAGILFAIASRNRS